MVAEAVFTGKTANIVSNPPPGIQGAFNENHTKKYPRNFGPLLRQSEG